MLRILSCLLVGVAMLSAAALSGAGGEKRDMDEWRNVMCPGSEPDAEIRRINRLEAEIGKVPVSARRIRALISRIDPLSHYRAFENIEFVVTAIGVGDYPGSPAVDVLWRHGQIDEERRDTAKRYTYCMQAWAEEKPEEEAADERPECRELLAHIYATLGEPDECKRWLALSLAKTLKEHAYRSWDFIADYGDEEFVRAAYLGILGREPSPDDLAFRVRELQEGKSREVLFNQILASEEHRESCLIRVAGVLKGR